MRGQKIIIGSLSFMLSFGAFAQDETDDLYFFESDAKKVTKKEILSQPITTDQPSELSKFANPDYAGGEELDAEAYTPTYNYYDNNFDNYTNGFQSGYAARNGWFTGGAYASPFYAYNSFGYSRGFGNSVWDCPPGSFAWNNRFGYRAGFNAWCPPGSSFSIGFGQTWYSAARWNTQFRYFNTFNNWSYNNLYCPQGSFGNTVSTPIQAARNTARAVRSNRSSSGIIANRANGTASPRTYATRSSIQSTRRSVTRSGRSISDNRSGRYGSGFSSGTRSSSYSRSSFYNRGSSGRSSSYSRGFSGSRSNSSFSGRSSSSRSSSSVGRSSSSRSSSGTRSSGSRSTGTRRR